MEIIDRKEEFLKMHIAHVKMLVSMFKMAKIQINTSWHLKIEIIFNETFVSRKTINLAK